MISLDLIIDLPDDSLGVAEFELDGAFSCFSCLPLDFLLLFLLLDGAASES